MQIDEFADAYIEFKRMSAEGSPQAPPDGSQNLWKSFRGLIDHFKSKTSYPRPQSIESLEAMGVSRSQIGSNYGWVLPTGGPDLTKISKELANPGTHYKQDEWQHPGKVNRQQIIDAAWNQRGLNRSPIFVDGGTAIQVPKRTLEKWEQGTGKVPGPACVLLGDMVKSPDHWRKQFTHFSRDPKSRLRISNNKVFATESMNSNE